MRVSFFSLSLGYEAASAMWAIEGGEVESLRASDTEVDENHCLLLF